jgi:hypothetical protein
MQNRLTATHVTVQSLIRKVEVVCQTLHGQFPLLFGFMMTCTQEVSNVVGLSDKILKEIPQGTSTIKCQHLNVGDTCYGER